MDLFSRMVALAAALAAAAGLLAGCSAAPSDAAAKSEFEKLWKIDIGQPGFTRSGASRAIDRKGEEIHISLCIAPEEYAQTPQSDMKRITANGREFLFGENAICWDGMDNEGHPIGGTQYSRRLLWGRNGYAYQVFAETNREDTFSVSDKGNGSLTIASPEMALTLESNPIAELAGFTVTSDIWQVEFTSAKITVSATLYPPQSSDGAMRDFITDGSLIYKNEAGMEYYARGSGQNPEDPMASTLLWKTDKGVVYLSAGVPWIYRGDVPKDVLGFVNPELAKSITVQLNAKIVPFGDTK